MKYLYILILFVCVSCVDSKTTFFSSNKTFPEIYFDAVEKELYFQDDIPVSIRDITSGWFEEKVKVNGYEGLVRISFTEYEEIITVLYDGKKIDMSLNFLINFTYPNNLKKKEISGSVNSFGIINGNFSISEFDALVMASRFELLSQLSNKISNSN